MIFDFEFWFFVWTYKINGISYNLGNQGYKSQTNVDNQKCVQYKRKFVVGRSKTKKNIVC